MKFMLPTIKIKIEKWKFNKEYQVWVSTEGRFRDANKQDLNLKIGTDGYVRVRVTNEEKKKMSAHRLVLMTWRPTDNMEELTVDHKNHNKRDNALSNLEWVTPDENLRRSQRDLIQTGAPKGAYTHLEIVVIGENRTFTIGESFTIKGEDGAILTAARLIDERVRRDDFSRTMFTKTCRDIINGKIPQGSKKYYGFEIKGRR